MDRLSSRICMVLFLASAAQLPVAADEGMWTFNNLPRQQLKERYGFEPSDAWLDHLRLASVRFNSGGSGSFVSSNGLVMTNHHIASDCLQKLGSSGRDYYRDGFYAARPSAEGKCPDLELNVLTGIEDVTAQVNKEVPPEMDAARAFAAQRAAMSKLESDCAEASKLRCDVVTLFQGGMFNLYKYKKYTDVRLVFAPEFDIAFFGGDPDNFTFPRYDLDVAFVRAYENGMPARVQHFLKWSRNRVREGDLVFVSGHPGTTNRMNTMARLEYLRDKGYPFTLAALTGRRDLLHKFSSESAENARIAKEELFSIENSVKAYLGELEGLRDPALMVRKEAEEKALRAAVEADPKKHAAYAGAWDTVAAAEAELAQFYRERGLFESGLAFDSRLFEIARTLVRLTAEKEKPNGDRLREYRDSNLSSVELDLYSPAPIYDGFEKVKLADSLRELRDQLGGGHPLVQKTLAGKAPSQAATEWIEGTHLQDVAERKRLAAGGTAAIRASDDPMIQLALRVDDDSRAFRKRYEDKVQGPERAAYALIARAIFDTAGTSAYPDATFTLRLAFGAVKGYQDQGRLVPPVTDFKGLYERTAQHGNQDPYRLPPRWIRGKGKLNLSAPFNFVSTADIIGGNSGSPVVNRNGEVVGLIFDGNIQSLVWNFLYDDRQGRAVSVEAQGIMEALRKMYNAKNLVEELTR